MKRIDIKALVLEILREFKADGTIKKVATDYPQSWNDFPTAIYRTSSKPHFVDGKGDELLTKWHVTIEIYDTKPNAQIVERLLERFSSLRIFFDSKDGNTANLKRTILEKEFVVDNTLKIIYEK